VIYRKSSSPLSQQTSLHKILRSASRSSGRATSFSLDSSSKKT
jgi:hypothetical protein